MANPQRPDRLDILISEYEACRDDERNFTALSAALYGVAATLLGLLAAATTQACGFNRNTKTCLPVPHYLIASAPLLPLIVFAYTQTQAAISVVRTYYIRGLEVEISSHASEPLVAFANVSSVPPMSFVGVVTALASLRRGRTGFRFLINFSFLAVILVFGGVTIYIGTHLPAPYQIAMLFVYGPVAVVLITETLAATIGGRGLFLRTLQNFSAYEPRSSEFRAPAARSERSLTSYLLFPRQEEVVKWLIAPGVFLVAAWANGALGNWPRFLLLWLVFEYLIYYARYQWNDTRGIDEDLAHAAQSSRKRLPVRPPNSARVSVAASLATAMCRILAAIAIGLCAHVLGQIAALIIAVFGVAVIYEFLRWRSRAARAPRARNADIHAIWIVVGLGYAIRASVGLVSAEVPLGSLRMVTSLAFFADFGVTFVLLTWVLEASSYCRAVPDPDHSQTWYEAGELTERPHIEKLPGYAGVTLVPEIRVFARPEDRAEDPGYCGRFPVLRATPNRRTPWNVAFAAGATLGAAAGISLAAPPRYTGPLYAASMVVSLAGAFAVTADRRPLRRWIWVLLVACALAILPVSGTTRLPVALVSAIPWITISSLYVMFRESSYADLKEFSPGAILGAIRHLAYGGLALLLKAVVGPRTWQRLTRSGGPSSPAG